MSEKLVITKRPPYTKPPWKSLPTVTLVVADRTTTPSRPGTGLWNIADCRNAIDTWVRDWHPGETDKQAMQAERQANADLMAAGPAFVAVCEELVGIGNSYTEKTSAYDAMEWVLAAAEMARAALESAGFEFATVEDGDSP